MMPAGRPTDYNDELAEAFCVRIAGGRSTMSVCDDDDMPCQQTIYRWRREKPEFSEKLACARDERLEADAHKIKLIADRVMEDASLDPQRANAAVNAIDKAARLMAPKTRVEVTGKDGGAIKTEEVSDPLMIARRMAFLLAGAAAKAE